MEHLKCAFYLVKPKLPAKPVAVCPMISGIFSSKFWQLRIPVIDKSGIISPGKYPKHFGNGERGIDTRFAREDPPFSRIADVKTCMQQLAGFSTAAELLESCCDSHVGASFGSKPQLLAIGNGWLQNPSADWMR